MGITIGEFIEIVIKIIKDLMELFKSLTAKDEEEPTPEA